MLAADVVFVAIVILFGHEILDVFGPHYRVAYPALVAVSLANAVSAIMGFAPIYLLFNGEHGKVLGLSIGATLIAILAIAWFAEHGKFLLVAYAFAIALVTLFGAFRVAAAFRQRKSQSQG